MTKVKVVFTCRSCGHTSPKWLGRCQGCGEWNTMAEEAETPRPLPQSFVLFDRSENCEPRPISEVETENEMRIATGIGEFDRILGGGLVKGSVVLVGGSPGVGKSTLLLQVSNFMASSGLKVLYVSGEESMKQTKLRAERVGTKSPNLYVVNETSIELIADYVKRLSPQMVVVDSVQVLFRQDVTSSPGSVSQVRECGASLTFMAKKMNVAVFLIGHVTKEGMLAGPRLLEHMVDTVLYFEGEVHTSFRVLRAIKNRFGSTNEIGVFEMTSKGLAEVDNPSRIFLEERPKHISGSVVVSVMEGSRSVLVEIQALTSPTSFSIPRRQSQGLDYNRVSLLAAVLEKRLGLNLKQYDVFVNIAGGLKIVEPAVDLGVAVSIVSSFREAPTQVEDVWIGEVGLGGEIRGVTQMAKRITEAAKMGFKRVIIPKSNLKELNGKGQIKVIGVSTVKEAVDMFV